MPIITTTVSTPLEPAEVVQRLTDFSPARADAFAGVDASGLTVHASGPDWADVTEGNKIGWERERYSWDVSAGTVTSVTSDSNLWSVGDGWDYAATAQPGGGSTVTVTARRNGRNVKGKLVGLLLGLVGKKMITKSTAAALS